MLSIKFKLDRQFIRSIHPRNIVKKCGLACAGEADDTEDLAVLDFQRHVMQRMDLLFAKTEILGYVFQLNQ